MNRPRRITRALALSLVVVMAACGSKTSPRTSETDEAEGGAPAPPPGVLGRITLGPLPQAFAGLTALGRALGAWDTETDVFFDEIRALAEGVSPLGALLDWEREAHLLILDKARLPSRFALILPAADPAAALRQLAERCASTQRDGLWHFTGSGGTLVPCRFFVRDVPGGLVVAPEATTTSALARHGQALLDPRLRPPRGARAEAPGGEAPGSDPPTASAPAASAPLVEARAFLPALRERFGIDNAKTTEWITMGALAIAMASGDFSAAGGLKEDLERLLAQIDSLDDVGLALELGASGVTLRLFATGRRGGALAAWVRSLRTPALSYHQKIEPGASVALALAGAKAGAPETGAAGSAREPGSPPGAGQRGSEPRPATQKRSALAAVVPLILGRLPEPFRAPARRLWQTLTGPGSGELALALGHPTEGALAFDIILDHTEPEKARQELFEAAHSLLTTLRNAHGRGAKRATQEKQALEAKGKSGTAAGASASPDAPALFDLTIHRGSEADRIDILPAEGRAPIMGAALRLLFGSRGLSLAVAHREGRVALSLALGAETRAVTLLKEAPPSGAQRRGPRTLGRLALSLVELSRLMPGLWPEDAPRPKGTGALLLHWGIVPRARRVELVITLPSTHLKAIDPLWQELSARVESSTGDLSTLLGLPDEAEDAL